MTPRFNFLYALVKVIVKIHFNFFFFKTLSGAFVRGRVGGLSGLLNCRISKGLKHSWLKGASCTKLFDEGTFCSMSESMTAGINLEPIRECVFL